MFQYKSSTTNNKWVEVSFADMAYNLKRTTGMKAKEYVRDLYKGKVIENNWGEQYRYIKKKK